jgi:tetratricopeptide (TPR) repeat protein
MGETKQGVGTDVTVRDPRDDLANSDTLHTGDPRASAPLVGSGTAPAGEPTRGDSVGRFVVLGVLGSGGMGLVYSAYDPHLDRKVAIKLLNAATVRRDVSDATTRLLREAQALAKINHPNVIKVHEVGTYGDQVYLAMEFADAGTIGAWLETKRSRDEILDVFVRAGRGLAAAHAAGLVHRDFKPDNVLMTKDGGVLVTDFGLVGVMAANDAPVPAAVERPLEAADLRISSTPLSQNLTRTGSIMGTPAYMAPEQFTGATNASAAADQFSFCAALYEALYRTRPYRGDSMQALATSVLLGEVSAAPPNSGVPGWLRRVLLRGLSTDPANRYPSMAALLANLEREPLRRRRRTIAIVAMAVGLAAAAALVFALRPGSGAQCAAGDDRVAGAWNAERRAQIQAAFAATKQPYAAAAFDKLTTLLDAWALSWSSAYRDACEDTRVRGEQSERLLDLRMQCLTRRLDDADATVALLASGPDAVGRALEAASALPSVASCADGAALDVAVAPPETAAVRAQVQAIRASLDQARGQSRLGRSAKAAEIVRAALVAARASGYQPVEAEALLTVGIVEIELGQASAARSLRDAMHAAAGSGDTTTMVDAAGWLIAAMALRSERPDIALEIAALVETTGRHARAPTESLARLSTSIGMIHMNRGQPADARVRFEQALALAEPVLGADHPQVLTTLTQLGHLAATEGRFEDARKQLERVRATSERLFGASHPKVADAANNLGLAYRKEGKYAEAKQLYDRALTIQLATRAPDHPEVATSHLHLGDHHHDQADYAKAQVHYEQALRIVEAGYGPDHVETAKAMSKLADTSLARGELDNARKTYEKVIATLDAVYGPDHPTTSGILTNLGVTVQRQGKLDEARAIFERAQRGIEKVYGSEHPDVVDTMANIATIMRAQGKGDEALVLTLRILKLAEKLYGAQHPRIGMISVNLGNLQYMRDDHQAAIESYGRSLAIFEAKLGKNHPNLSYSLAGLGGALAELDRGEEAVPYLERAIAIREAAGMPAIMLAPVRYALAKALGGSPKTRPRAIAEATKALAAYVDAKDETNGFETRKLLRELRAR